MVNVWFDPRFTATVPEGEMLPLTPAVAVIVGLIVWLRALDVLLEKLLEPPVYSAVMLLCKPTVRLEVEQEACPLASSDTPLQMGDPPSLNVTEPSPAPGLPVPAPVPVTVAVKVTESPKVEGVEPEVLAVAV